MLQILFGKKGPLLIKAKATVATDSKSNQSSTCSADRHGLNYFSTLTAPPVVLVCLHHGMIPTAIQYILFDHDIHGVLLCINISTFKATL